MLVLAIAGSVILLCVLGPLALAASVSQARLECFESLVARRAPLSDFTHFLGNATEPWAEESNCHYFDIYFGTSKSVCIQEGDVINGGGLYACGASLAAMIQHSYKIVWSLASDAEERRALQCTSL